MKKPFWSKGWPVIGLIVLVLLAAVLVLPGREPARAAGSGYDLGWWTVDGGGSTLSAAGGYSLGGTAGQPDPGVLSSGGYALGGGFWRGGAPAEGGYWIYLPVVLKGG